jgi:hypothetical protein
VRCLSPQAATSAIRGNGESESGGPVLVDVDIDQAHRCVVILTVYDLQMFIALVIGGERPSTDADLIGTNWSNAYREASDPLLAAWRRRGTAGTLQLRMGDFPATWATGMHLAGQTVHGWDLASATGQSTDLGLEVGQAALNWAARESRALTWPGPSPRGSCAGSTRRCMTA